MRVHWCPSNNVILVYIDSRNEREWQAICLSLVLWPWENVEIPIGHASPQSLAIEAIPIFI